MPKIGSILVQWLMESGADASALAPRTASDLEFVRTSNGMTTNVHVIVAGKPAIGVLVELREALRAKREKEALWSHDAEVVNTALQLSTKHTIPGAIDLEWMWTAISYGEVEFAKTGSAAFDFTAAHSLHGTPLTAFLGPCLQRQGSFLKERRDVISQSSQCSTAASATQPNREW